LRFFGRRGHARRSGWYSIEFLILFALEVLLLNYFTKKWSQPECLSRCVLADYVFVSVNLTMDTNFCGEENSNGIFCERDLGDFDFTTRSKLKGGVGWVATKIDSRE
jgi:hypothetical protein